MPPPMSLQDLQDPPDPPNERMKPLRVHKKYICTCQKFCLGRPQNVSKTTYFRHRTVAAVSELTQSVVNGLRRKRTGTDRADTPEGSDGDAHTPKRARTREVSPQNTPGPGEHNGDLRAFSPLSPDRAPLAHSPSPEPPAVDPFADPPVSRYASEDPPRRAHRATVEDALDEDDDPDAEARRRENAQEDAPGRAEALQDVTVTLEDMKRALDFIRLLKGATLESALGGLSAETCELLRNPPEELLEIDNPDHMLSIELYLDLHNASQDHYNKVCATLKRHYPERQLLSFYLVKKKVEMLTGIVPIVHDMCVASCVAFTGPYSQLDKCPRCSEPRYDELDARKNVGAKKVARQQFYTMPIGPQIQAQYRTPEGAAAMGYLSEAVEDVVQQIEATGRLKSFDDISHGSRFWGAYAAQQIGKDDVVVMMSIDGAQLYRSKKSDCWIYIWVVLNLGPDKRYRRKYVLPGAVIPGPNHPKDLDSFLFPGLFHVSALMREGLTIWDASKDSARLVYLFLALVLADGPAMALMSGMVGHTGRRGCRLYCPLIWRRKPKLGTYYPVLLQPAPPYSVPGCSHGDVDLAALTVPPSTLATEYNDNIARLVASQTTAEYERVRKETGLSKPSIFSGLSRRFDLPGCFPLDYMHLVALNITDLFLGLWRGTISGSQQDASGQPWAVLQDDLWLEHGAKVARAAAYLPGSFDRPPRNIAEKISSGYKAKEWMTYFYGYGPAMLRRVLPGSYLRNYCKFVAAGQLMGKTSISRSELMKADQFASQAANEFEVLYYNRDVDLLHHVRPCIHAMAHGPRQIPLSGPLMGHTQYIMERSIGDLGGEIRQPSNPFANLSERALLRCQINALKAMIPSLDPGFGQPYLPRGSLDLGAGYVLLRARDRSARWVSHAEAVAFHTYFGNLGHDGLGDPAEFSLRVQKWARLRLPNDQVARSAWKEEEQPLSKVRIARVVKAVVDGRSIIGEVQYFCRITEDEAQGTYHTVAVVSVFGPRDEALYQELHGTVWLAPYLGSTALRVIDVTCIQSVVGMVPDSDVHINAGNMVQPHFQVGSNYFLVEKLGLDASHRAGMLEVINEDDEPDK